MLRRREGESSSEDEDHNEQDSLAALEANFAKSFEMPVVRVPRGSKKKGRMNTEEVDDASADRAVVDAKKESLKATQAEKPRRREPETVVFGQSSGSSAPTSSGSERRGDWRKFMSSKVTTKTDEEKKAELLKTQKSPKTKKAAPEGETAKEQEDEKQAETNDRALSNLLSTTLFAPGGAGSSSVRSNGRPNLGSNDTLARLLELTSSDTSKGRGLGAAMLKSQDMSKMPATIRHGMRRVELENQERELQRQKELGNYHHSIKGLIGKRDGLDLILGTKEKDRRKRTREKGLSMGVGKFSGGTLKLSDGDVQRINKSGGSSSKKRRT
jgi:hypothetical protein